MPPNMPCTISVPTLYQQSTHICTIAVSPAGICVALTLALACPDLYQQLSCLTSVALFVRLTHSVHLYVTLTKGKSRTLGSAAQGEALEGSCWAPALA